MLSSLHHYSEFVYELPDTCPSIQRFQLILSPRGATVGLLEGTVEFDHGVVLRVLERLDFARQRIVYYSYEVRREGALLYWYDPWPHPNDPTLAATHPHHKHVPPNLKHHRILAPDLSFEHPNLPFLIEEIERELLAAGRE